MNLNEIVKNIKKPIYEKIEDQRKICRTILQGLRENGHPEAIVAGGAPRNWEFGRPARDLDIYISAPCYEKQLKKIPCFEDIVLESVSKKSWSWDGLITKVSASDHFESNHQILDVQEADYKGTKIQIITIDKKFNGPEDFASHIFKTFDIGICKIAWNDLLGILKSLSFVSDLENKTLTVNMGELETPRNLPSRLEKMEEYFPDHKVKII